MSPAASTRTLATTRTAQAVYSRAKFISDLQDIGQLRALWIPAITDTTTTVSTGPAARTWTYDATISARVSTLGYGALVTFNGTSGLATTPDTADMSFGIATADNPMSIAVLANVTDTAGTRALISRYSPEITAREFDFYVTSADKLSLLLHDESAAVAASRLSDAVITQAATKLYGCSYTGGGGATAANGIVLFQDAAVIASTATNNAGYVAMENTASVTTLGAERGSAFTGFFSGSMGAAVVYADYLSTAQHVAIKAAFNRFFGLAL